MQKSREIKMKWIFRLGLFGGLMWLGGWVGSSAQVAGNHEVKPVLDAGDVICSMRPAEAAGSAAPCW